MGGICRRMDPECIILDVEEQEKERVIRLLAEKLAETHRIDDSELLVKDILEREQLASTCLGLGCAVPHAHTAAAASTVIAAARLGTPQDFDTPDGKPVSLVFLMAGPPNSAGLHIRLLSKLARLLHNSVFRESLKHAETSEEFYQIICDKDG